MFSSIRNKRSAGVPVTGVVHRLINQANAARDLKAWKKAAEIYREVLARDAGLAHIWVQLGHALKESGQLDEARTAYRRAVELKPADADPLLHLGHLAKLNGDRREAARLYLSASEIDPKNADAVVELHRLLHQPAGTDHKEVLQFLRVALADSASGSNPLQERPETIARAALSDLLLDAGKALNDSQRSTLLAVLDHIDDGTKCGADRAEVNFDVSDLVSYWSGARLPTGIQRVQMEIIRAALASNRGDFRICCFIEGRDHWIEVMAAEFVHLSDLSVRSGDRNDAEWLSALTSFRLKLAIRAPFEFTQGAWLLNLGTSWWLQNYFLLVRHARETYSIRYVPFVHDLIPVLAAEHCVEELTRDFTSWITGVFSHASYFLVNSEATKRDLQKVATMLGYHLRDEDIATVRLDGQHDRQEIRVGRGPLAKQGLSNGPFVLFVGTLESRKGHLTALGAWQRLIAKYGAKRVPKLVCVGSRGWLNDEIFARLAADPSLAGRTALLSKVNDADLDALYHHCLFTIYPSFYEGWGLPVTESLSRGKVVITTDASSLPEAGGEFATYVAVGSEEQLAEAVERLAFDAGHRASQEARIRERFRSRTWSEVSGDIELALSSWERRPSVEPTMPAPMAKLNQWHALTVVRKLTPDAETAAGEVFRSGVGWHWPDEGGCWTKPGGGELTIGLPPGPRKLRLYLQLRGLEHSGYRCTIHIEGHGRLFAVVDRREDRWVSFDLERERLSEALRLFIFSEYNEELSLVMAGRIHSVLVSAGLTGFLIAAKDNLLGRRALLESISVAALT